jgi:rRNA pseudouridine-1189 N-methylase Emg1 (Nep1/Mra1 family)
MNVLDECVSISDYTLDAWIVVSRVITECEKRMGLL